MEGMTRKITEYYNMGDKKFDNLSDEDKMLLLKSYFFNNKTDAYTLRYNITQTHKEINIYRFLNNFFRELEERSKLKKYYNLSDEEILSVSYHCISSNINVEELEEQYDEDYFISLLKNIHTTINNEQHPFNYNLYEDKNRTKKKTLFNLIFDFRNPYTSQYSQNPRELEKKKMDIKSLIGYSIKFFEDIENSKKAEWIRENMSDYKKNTSEDIVSIIKVGDVIDMWKSRRNHEKQEIYYEKIKSWLKSTCGEENEKELRKLFEATYDPATSAMNIFGVIKEIVLPEFSNLARRNFDEDEASYIEDYLIYRHTNKRKSPGKEKSEY